MAQGSSPEFIIEMLAQQVESIGNYCAATLDKLDENDPAASSAAIDQFVDIVEGRIESLKNDANDLREQS